MLLVTVLSLAILQCQCLSPTADLSGLVDEFNDALESGLDSVNQLIQNTGDHLPAAINQAFDYLKKIERRQSITKAANSMFESTNSIISQIKSESEKFFNELRVFSDDLKFPENILKLIVDHHAKQDFHVEKVRRDIGQFLTVHHLEVSKADEKVASYIQHKTNAIKQIVTSLGSAVNDINDSLRNMVHSPVHEELLNQRIVQALSSGLKNLGSAVLFAREEMKDAMSH
ncbi:uncharacterized protein LOC125659574 isoform X2 [Ostrea edulis]|uniref:uncharacterized protein LOC125659574 isoform X2 n=1 Tax=Ostrea edulis TaxID=37623 RepID=UPI0024AEC08D|nr:uncharacterized protein LOC125659574 isoform X2 [Ostrea edulis]